MRPEINCNVSSLWDSSVFSFTTCCRHLLVFLLVMMKLNIDSLLPLEENFSLYYTDLCIDSDYLFKLLLIGDSGVGKSCLLLRFAVCMMNTAAINLLLLLLLLFKVKFTKLQNSCFMNGLLIAILHSYSANG